MRTIERQHLPHMRIGGQNRYLRSECEAFVRGAAPEPAAVIELKRPEAVA